MALFSVPKLRIVSVFRTKSNAFHLDISLPFIMVLKIHRRVHCVLIKTCLLINEHDIDAQEADMNTSTSTSISDYCRKVGQQRSQILQHKL